MEQRFKIACDIPIARPSLALENALHTMIYLQRSEVAVKPIGLWADEAIHTVRLPVVKKGQHSRAQHAMCAAERVGMRGSLRRYDNTRLEIG